MTLHFLKFKADLENIKQLHALPNNKWVVDVQRTDGEGAKEGVVIIRSQAYDLDDHSHGKANVVLKDWPHDKTECWIKIVEHKGVNDKYTAKDSGTSVPVLALECHGVVPTGWTVGRDFVSESVAGLLFENVDLNSGQWTAHDDLADREGVVDPAKKGGDETGIPVRISNVEATVE